MLQMMQKKVQAEGEAEQELFDKFMCYCKNGAAALDKSIADAGDAIPELGANIEAGEGQLVQLKEDLKKHQVDRSAAKTAMAEATGVRGKEAAEFSKEKAELSSNLDAMGKAIKAIESGMAGGFLQTNTAQVLKKLAMTDSNLLDADRQDIMAFLSGGHEGQYAPASGQIVGILSTMKEEMSKSLSEAESAESSALQEYEATTQDNEVEKAAKDKAVSYETKEAAQLDKAVTEVTADRATTQSELDAVQEYLTKLEGMCVAKPETYADRADRRASEIAGLKQALSILDGEASLLQRKTKLRRVQ